MEPVAEKTTVGRVRSMHVHPEQPGAAMRSISTIELVAHLGIREDPRYFGRLSRSTGQPSLRHISLIEREQINEHARALGLEQIVPGAVRANLETEGVQLVELLGRRLRVGGAVLLLYEARTPCAKMDAICQGLRALMENRRQGVLAQVIQSGQIKEGDRIELAPED